MKPSLVKFSFQDFLYLVLLVVFALGLIFLPFKNSNNRGVLFMLKKDYEKAGDELIKCLDSEEDKFLCRMNRAFNHFLLKQYEQSIQEYGIVESTAANKNLLFFSAFNSALSAGSKGDRDLALKFYQKALLYRPESLEVKTNIELLLKEQKADQNNKRNEKENKQKQDNGEKKGEEQKEQNGEEQGEEEQNGEEQKKDKKQSGEKQKKDSKETQKEGDSREKKKEEEQSGEKQKKDSEEKQKEEQRGSREKQKSGPKQDSEEQQAGAERKENSQEALKDTRQKESRQEDPKDTRQKESRQEDPKDMDLAGKAQARSSEAQQLSDKQIQAVLKSILEQEKQIRKKQQKHQSRSSLLEKDW